MTPDEVAQYYAKAMTAAVRTAIGSGGLSLSAMTQIAAAIQSELVGAARATSTLHRVAPEVQDIADIVRKIAAAQQQNEDAKLYALLRETAQKSAE